MASYINQSAVKVLRVLKALGKNRFQPTTATQLVTDLSLSLDTVFRALKTLESEGFAKETEHGWQTGPEVIQFSERFWQEFDKQPKNSS